MNSIINAIRRLVLRLPAPRAVREQQLIEQTILSIAVFWNAYGSSYERMRRACLAVAACYPGPTYQTLMQLFEDMATDQPTDLAHMLYYEYCRKPEETK